MNKTDTRKVVSRLAAALVAAAAFASVHAQERLSLAERVSRLEQQAQQQQGTVSLVNQVQALQSQVQQLQGQVEELSHQLQELQQRNKDQYVDLDSRIGRLEGRAPAAGQGNTGADGANPPAAAGPNSPASAPAAAAPANAPAAAPAQATAPVAPAASAGTSPEAQAAYDQAFQSIRGGDFAEASRRFKAFIQKYPNTDLTPNAYYWLGESYYATQNYPIAVDAFQKVIERYPQSAKAPDALLKVGYCQYELKQWDAAAATFNNVIAKYPNTTPARLAEGRLRALKLQAGR